MSTRRFLAGLALAAAAITAGTVPAQAQATPTDQTTTTTAADTPVVPTPRTQTRIIGGTVAANGAWPSQVALLFSDEPDNWLAQFCGGTIINPSWILTAAHCVSDPAPTVASQIDVLIGTQDLDSGGTRHRAVEIRKISGYNGDTYDRDFALIRIGTPSAAPLQAIAAQGEVTASGTSATITGWGNTSTTGNSYPTTLRQVTLPVMTNTACSQAGYGSYITAQMICAGQSPYSKDSCQGDSGGPMVVNQSGTWVQVGIVSWGDGCAIRPGVYSRVAAQSTWIKTQIRYGPHSNASAFVTGSYKDLYNRAPSASELNSAISALTNSQTPSAWLSSQIQGTTYQARTAAVTRLYRAFFLRDPDTSGLTYWWKKINGGTGLSSIASVFSQSSEFNNRYGSLNNGQYVDLVYQNVLGRAPDASGRAYWKGQLDNGTRTRGGVMIGFSESNEYKRTTKTRVDAIITYFAMIRRVPTAAELTASMARPNATQVGLLLNSVTYHARY
jgi:secreted trypsin-like serine protease